MCYKSKKISIQKMEWSMMKKFMILGLFVILVIAGCDKSSKTVEEVQVPVDVMKIGLGNVEQSLFYNGDIEAEIEVKVFAKIPDRIEAFYVDEGYLVQKGDTLARILATTIEQAVRQAEASKNNIEAEYIRAQRLFHQGAMSQQQFDAIETQATQMRAAYTSARSQLGDATVLAPISGIIGKRYYEVGDMVNPAMPLVSIVQMNRVKILFDATEKDLGILAIGQKAEVRVRSYPNEIFVGKVIKISPVLDPMTRMASVEVIIPNSDHRLKPGLYGEVEITTGILDSVLVVPRHAVLESTSLKKIEGKDEVVKTYFVYVVNDSSRAEQRELDVYYVNHSCVAVKSGVSVGDVMVVSGQNNLREGTKVNVASGEEATQCE
jgi:RND family efflux transporter MFP subunit